MRKLVFLLLFISCRSHYVPPIVFQEDFEQPDFRDNWDAIDTCNHRSIVRTDSVSRTGKWSLRIELNKNDTTEDGLNLTELANNLLDMDTTQRWWGFSNFLPVDFAIDSVHEVFADWIPKVEACETAIWAPVMLNLYKDRWRLVVKWNTKGVCRADADSSDFGSKEFDLGTIEKGKWTDWIFHIHFSFGDDGYVQVWKNGQKVVDYMGPCFYKDAEYAYFKIGVSKWVWGSRWPRSQEQSVTRHRHYYLDHIRIGNGKASKSDFDIKL